jgi:hypothetical protein
MCFFVESNGLDIVVGVSYVHAGWTNKKNVKGTYVRAEQIWFPRQSSRVPTESMPLIRQTCHVPPDLVALHGTGTSPCLLGMDMQGLVYILPTDDLI